MQNKTGIKLSKRVPGGLSNDLQTIMKVTSADKLTSRLLQMHGDKSVVVKYEQIPTLSLIRLTNESGHETYLHSDYTQFIDSLNVDGFQDVYISDIPELGYHWHGGYVFVKAKSKTNQPTWYIIAPVKYDTVRIPLTDEFTGIEGSKAAGSL